MSDQSSQSTVRPVGDAATDQAPPTVVFRKFAPNTYEPMRADRAAAGSLPVRGYRYCEAVTSASAFGWYLFPPIDFVLQFDGAETVCNFPDHGDEWYPLLNGVPLPGMQEHFAAQAPEDLQGFLPPFMVALPEPGVVQIWSGYFAQTAPDWSLLVRAPANVPRSLNYQHYEGIVEFDAWPGSVFTNLRLLKTDYPIEFQKSLPLMQVQPVHRSVYSGDFLNRFTVAEPDWDAYRKVVLGPNTDAHRRKGAYAIHSRKRDDAPAPSFGAEQSAPKLGAPALAGDKPE